MREESLAIGAGDLGLCAPLGAALIGRGEVYLNGRRMPAAEALRAAGLTPARLGPKDGLAILNASAVSCGYGALVLAELSDVLSASMVVAARTSSTVMVPSHRSVSLAAILAAVSSSTTLSSSTAPVLSLPSGH